MYKKQVYLAIILLMLAASTTVQAEVFTDDFETPYDYVAVAAEDLGRIAQETIWDDFIGWMPGETVDALNASIDRPGQLYIASTNGAWDPFDNLGPFLFKVVQGDFIATVKVTDYAGTADAAVAHNDGGLMARAYLDDAGPGEDWVSIDYFPIWTGNMIWEARDGVRNEAWSCAYPGWDAAGTRWDVVRPYLRLERIGNTFHFYISPDGENWEEMACSPKTRDDFDGLPLMVGLRHATYSSDQGYVAFDDFKLEVIRKLKAYDPVPSDGAEGVISALLEWTAGETAAFHDVYFGTNPAPGEAEYQGRQALTTYEHSPGLIPGITYYWRIDEVEADGATIHQGDVWSFTATSFTAWNPSPADDTECILTDADLSWGAGSTANRHEVYFGTDETAVANATTDSAEFKSSQSGTTYEPGNLVNNTTYFWRIDEVEEDGTTHKGQVWSFKTLADISIYNPNQVGWWKLDGGCAGNNIVVDSSGYNQHGILRGDPQWVAGYDGGALQLDGRGDYVELPIGSLIGSLTNSTFMLWIDSVAGGSWVRAFDFNNDPNVYMCLGPRWWFMDDMYFAITTSGEDNQTLVQPTGFDIETGWHHVAVTINADESTFILYYDGEELARNTFATLSPQDLGNTTNNWLGRSHDPENSYYLGFMDDFRIYNYALSQAEIARAMLGDPRLAWNPMPVNTVITDIENALPLNWTPGEQAAQHDVYLGTDELAVDSADTSDTTGIYRGRQDANSYTPPEGVEPNQVYYWRIDEVNTDTTISKGRVWSFTVADYLIVDDFEHYDDIDNKIFDTWIDTFVNNTGMTVGYFDPPFAEQTIVHSGRQSMYMRYDNDGTVNEGTTYEQSGLLLYSEAEREWTDPQDWTRKGVNSLALWFRGVPASVGSFTIGPPITMTAAGVDIWGTADQFHFAYKRLSGAGSITARVISITNTDPWAKAGVMIRQSLDADSVHAIVVVTPGNGVAYEYRPEAGGDSVEEVAQAGITAPQWVKLTRSGNNFTAEYSANGTTWNTLGAPIVIPMLVDVYVGLCLTSHNVDATCTAEFSDVAINGTVTGDWQSQDIGIASNIPEPMYVVLEDSAANSAVVKHPDPAATTIGTWTQWNIPLTDFAGVNLQAVKKMAIGVGDRANPQAGSSGTLYIDDIWLSLP
jgi:hypothetical protein